MIDMMKEIHGANVVKSPPTIRKPSYPYRVPNENLERDSAILREFLQHGQWMSVEKNRQYIDIPTEGRFNSALDNIGAYRHLDWMILDNGTAPLDPPKPKRPQSQKEKNAKKKIKRTENREYIMKRISTINRYRRQGRKWAWIADKIGIKKQSLYDFVYAVKKGRIKCNLKID